MDIGVPLYVGSLVVATIAGCGAYLIIQYLWRRKIRTDWQVRRFSRKGRKKARNQAS